MTHPRRKFVTLGLSTVTLISAALIAVPALASSGSGIASVVLVTADNDAEGHINSDRIKFQTKGPTDVRIQKLTFAAGAYSGWHHHPGFIIVAVKTGLVTLSQSDCSSKSYGPGSSNGAVFVEGHDDAQQATSAAGAEVYVTYVAPSADPRVFRIEDDPPVCATATTFRNSPAGN